MALVVKEPLSPKASEALDEVVESEERSFLLEIELVV
jgi:hypothetical protein